MPKESKKKASLLDLSLPKAKRGRPKKAVVPEMLLPSGLPEGKIKPPKNEAFPVDEKQKNRRVNPATSEKFYSAEEVEFMNALAEYKRSSGQTFPTCSEILNVLRSLGYEKVGVRN